MEQYTDTFLGVDPGFHVTGYSILRRSGSSIHLLDIGYLQMKPTKTLSERVGEFYAFFTQHIAIHGINHIALETSFLGKNAQTFLKLGYLRGILYLLADQNQCELHEFPPSQVKMATTGFGGASKDQVARVMLKMFPKLSEVKAVARNDATDALAIGMCGIMNSKKHAAFGL